MNVVLVIGTYIWTGAEQHVEYLARGLTARAHRVFVACREGTVVERRLKREFPVLPLPMTNAFDVVSGVRLARFLVQNDIEVVHTHHNKVGWFTLLAARIAKVERVFNTRHMVPENAKRDALHRWQMSRFEAVICPSEFARRLYQEAFPTLPAGKLVAVANGTQDCMKERPGGDEGGRVRLLAVGRLSVDKGTETLLRAMRILKGLPVRLQLTGEDDRGMEAWSREFIRENGLEGIVRIAGPSGDVREELSRADVFVLPSAIPESGGPMAMIEAMSCGLPVVVSGNGSQREIVTNGENGLLVESGDVGGLAAAIETLAGDGEMRARLGLSARRTYLERFTLQRMAEEMERVYRGDPASRSSGESAGRPSSR